MDHLIRAHYQRLSNEPLTNEERETAMIAINQMTKLRRLEMYLEWEGIIGYSTTIYEICTREQWNLQRMDTNVSFNYRH